MSIESSSSGSEAPIFRQPIILSENISKEIIEQWGVQCSDPSWEYGHLSCIDTSGEHEINMLWESSLIDDEAVEAHQHENWRNLDFVTFYNKLIVLINSEREVRSEEDFLKDMSGIKLQFNLKDVAIETKCILKIMSCLDKNFITSTSNRLRQFLASNYLKNQLNEEWSSIFKEKTDYFLDMNSFNNTLPELSIDELITGRNLHVHEFLIIFSGMLNEAREEIENGKSYSKFNISYDSSPHLLIFKGISEKCRLYRENLKNFVEIKTTDMEFTKKTKKGMARLQYSRRKRTEEKKRRKKLFP